MRDSDKERTARMGGPRCRQWGNNEALAASEGWGIGRDQN
jgi:hypothetical protein